MRHRQSVVWLQAPAELVEFDPTEWMTPNDQGTRSDLTSLNLNEVQDQRPAWGPAFCRWVDARHSWADKHGPEGLGGGLKLLRVEHQTLMGMYEQMGPRDD